MTRQEKATDLFNRTCQHCEEFSTKHKCEIQDTCPVYELYKMAKEKKHIIKPDEWQNTTVTKTRNDMSRQEDFIEAGIKYRFKHGKPMCIAGSNLADVERELNRVFPFEAGAEYGYQYAIDKACKWLEIMDVNEYLNIVPGFGYVIEDEYAIKAFRRVMEE